eukprot:6531500-Ditylum_brightwellii.AAC.1
MVPPVHQEEQPTPKVLRLTDLSGSHHPAPSPSPTGPGGCKSILRPRNNRPRDFTFLHGYSQNVCGMKYDLKMERLAQA